MANATDIRTAHVGFFDRVNGMLSSASARYARYRTFQRTVGEMASLSDRELRDLGLCRSQIKSVAYEHVYDAH